MLIETTIIKLYEDGHNKLSKLLAKQYLDFHPKNINIKELLIKCYLRSKEYPSAIEIINNIRRSRPINGPLLDRCTKYMVDIAKAFIFNQPSFYSVSCHSLPFITCTITTCKRLDLFIKTMDSFLSTCTDIHLISKFICVDDNSFEKDREVMEKKYPFFQFVWKTPEEKGHAKSMQMLTSMVDTPYMLHLEDDWQFFDGLDMITDAIEVLNDDPQIGQVLFNQNYAELPDNIPVGGHEKYTPDKLRYFIHEHCVNDAERANFSRKYPGGMHCNYWPHFSLRPSLIRTNIFKHIGFEDIISFEQNFGLNYVKHLYCSAFLQGARCKHIGRLTSDRTIKLNAYDLIAQPQFSPLKTFEAYVINLPRRIDRLTKFKDRTSAFNFNIDVFEAIDGKQLVSSPRLNALFEHNDHNMRRGIVGCALSHLKLWAQFYKNPTVNYYCIFEDDVKFHPKFEGSLNRVLSLASDNDIIFLGATPNPNCPPDYTTNQGVITASASHSLKYYWGGTFGYLISFNGVKRMFDYIEKTTMTNAIDTMIQKAADIIKVAYVIPAICNTELVSNDTDVQKDFNTGLNDGMKEIGDIKIYNAEGVPDFDIE